jgi:hypothetical protein
MQYRDGRRGVGAANHGGNGNGADHGTEGPSQLSTKFVHPHPAEDFGVIAWPADGGQGMLTAGATTIDLVGGTIDLSNGTQEKLSNSLRGLGLPHMHAAHFHPYFSSLSVELLYPTFPRLDVDTVSPAQIARAATTPPLWLDAQHHTITHAAFRQLKLYLTSAATMFIEFGPDPETAPVMPLGISSPIIHHFGPTVSTDTLTTLIGRPTAHNPYLDTNTTMSEANASVNNSNPGHITTVFAPEKTWFVQNTGANDVSVTIQIAPTGAPTAWIDDPDTAVAAVIGAGGSAVYRCQHQSVLTRIRIASTVAGAAGTINASLVFLQG